MLNTINFKTISLLLFLSGTGLCLWLLEINLVKGWYGLAWLHGGLYTPYIATLLAAMAYTFPYLLTNRFHTKKAGVATVIFYFTNVICYMGGKTVCYNMFCRFCLWSVADVYILLSIGLVMCFLFGLIHWYITKRLIIKIRKFHILTFSLLPLTAIALSVLNILLIPGFGSQSGFIDAVKMGYPVFWTILLLGLTAFAFSKKAIKQH